MYQHHIILKTKEPLEPKLVAEWLKTVKEFGPDDIAFAYQHGDHEVSMEYGTNDESPLPHSYVVPLKRDMTADEAFVVVSAWEYKYMPDFNIEISNMYDTMQDFEIDIDEDVKQQAIFDLNKWHHNRWRDEMLREGWHYGLYFSSKNKSHPALKDWDSLPESHRRSPQFTNKEIFEWLRKNGVA